MSETPARREALGVATPPAALATAVSPAPPAAPDAAGPPSDLAPLQADARLAIASLKAFLASPVFASQVPLALLTRMASDPAVPVKEQRRCREVLATLQLKATEMLASLTGAREQRLKDLGIDAAPNEVHVEQHNTKIEIVREGARDWRTGEGG